MSTDKTESPVLRPWYREPWPWILAAGPAIVVVAAIYTAWLAVKSNDGLVTEDYYRKGLAASQTIARNELAARLGLLAAIRVNEDRMSIRLTAADPAFSLPSTLAVNISHPTRAGLDQSMSMTREADIYTHQVRLPASGHWLVMVEDESRTWRLLGNVILPANGEVLIGARPAGGKPEPAEIRN